jgi:putative ABC transport system substrate-binding protein
VVSLALCVFAEAQQQKVAKIGWLGTGPASGPTSGPEVIRRELSKLGYVEGKNIAFEHRYYEGKLDRLPALCDELVRLEVNMILTSSSPATRAAKRQPDDSHSFLCPGRSCCGGLVEVSPPWGNVTGSTTISPVIAGNVWITQGNRSQAVPRRCAMDASTI